MAAEPPKLLGIALPPWMLGNDLQRAGKRILWGGVTGFVVAGMLSMAVTMAFFGDPAVTGVIQPTLGQFLYVLLESALMALLSVGVLKRFRLAAAALLVYHLVSKSTLFGLAVFGLAPGNLNPYSMTIFLLIPGYIFLQGLRGALTWHHLTHPAYPTAAGPDRGEGE